MHSLEGQKYQYVHREDKGRVAGVQQVSVGNEVLERLIDRIEALGRDKGRSMETSMASPTRLSHPWYI